MNWKLYLNYHHHLHRHCHHHYHYHYYYYYHHHHIINNDLIFVAHLVVQKNIRHNMQLLLFMFWVMTPYRLTGCYQRIRSKVLPPSSG